MNDLKIIADGLIPVYVTSTGERVVDARELHEKLMVGKDFTSWIKDRIEKYGFIEEEDFSPILGESLGGRPRTEYILKLATAKEIAMVQNNEMGRVARRYFIEVEEEFNKKSKQPMTQLEVLQGAINQMVAQEQRVNQLEQKQNRIEQENQVLKHRIDNLDNVNINGDLRQRLNAMVRKLANQDGIQYGAAWKVFVQSFNTAYKTNLELKRQHHINKTGKDISRPRFLEEIGLLEDAVRVADKMLNRVAN